MKLSNSTILEKQFSFEYLLNLFTVISIKTELYNS
jgi:hypothetical protein